jgi:hypothetical protein
MAEQGEVKGFETFAKMTSGRPDRELAAVSMH